MLGSFSSYISENSTLKGARLIIRDTSGDRYCTILKGDDPRAVVVGAQVTVRFDDDMSVKELKQNDKHIHTICGSPEHKDVLKQQFAQLDTNRNGTLDVTELRAVFQALVSRKMPKGFFDRLFNHVDTNGNGKVEIDEFIDWVMNGKKIPPRPKLAAPAATEAESSSAPAGHVCTTSLGAGLSVTIIAPTREEEAANIKERMEKILEDPGQFFKDGIGGGGTMCTLIAIINLATEPLSEGTERQKGLRAFRAARPALLANLDEGNAFFKGPHAAEPKSDDAWPAHIQALASAAYEIDKKKLAGAMGRLGMS